MAKRWAVLLVALCLLVAIVAVACAAGQVKAAKVLTADVVRAKRFGVVDAEGRLRGILHVSDSGAVGLALSQGGGQLGALAFLATETDGSTGLTLSDRNGKDRVVLLLGPNGSASLALSDRDGNGGAVLGPASLRAILLSVINSKTDPPSH